MTPATLLKRLCEETAYFKATYRQETMWPRPLANSVPHPLPPREAEAVSGRVRVRLSRHDLEVELPGRRVSLFQQPRLRLDDVAAVAKYRGEINGAVEELAGGEVDPSAPALYNLLRLLPTYRPSLSRPPRYRGEPGWVEELACLIAARHVEAVSLYGFAAPAHPPLLGEWPIRVRLPRMLIPRLLQGEIVPAAGDSYVQIDGGEPLIFPAGEGMVHTFSRVVRGALHVGGLLLILANLRAFTSLAESYYRLASRRYQGSMGTLRLALERMSPEDVLRLQAIASSLNLPGDPPREGCLPRILHLISTAHARAFLSPSSLQVPIRPLPMPPAPRLLQARLRERVELVACRGDRLELVRARRLIIGLCQEGATLAFYAKPGLGRRRVSVGSLPVGSAPVAYASLASLAAVLANLRVLAAALRSFGDETLGALADLLESRSFLDAAI